MSGESILSSIKLPKNALYFLWGFIVLLTIVSLALTVFWIMGQVVWPNQAAQYQQKSFLIYVNDSINHIEVRWPVVLLADANDAAIEVIYYYPEPNLTIECCASYDELSTLKITTQSEEINFVRESDKVLVEDVAFAFFRHNPKTHRIILQNTHTAPGRFLSNWLSEATIDVEVSSPLGVRSIPIRIKVETDWRAYLRKLSASDISERSPILLLFGLVLTLGGLTYKNYKDNQQEEVEALTKKIAGIWASIRDGKIDEAKNDFKNISKESQQQCHQQEYEIINNILSLADDDDKNEIDDETYKNLLNSHVNEVAEALFFAADKIDIQNSSSRLRHRIRIFPFNKLSDKSRQKFEQIRQKYFRYPLTPRNWPKYPIEMLPPEKIGETGFTQIFRGVTTEQEEGDLFSKRVNLFWNRHPLIKSLEQARCGSVILVQGEMGSGKTAIAKSIEYDGNDIDQRIVAYAYSPISEESVCRLFAKQILDFCLQNPNQLTRLGLVQRSLLAEVLVSFIDIKEIIAEIEYADPKFEQYIYNLRSKSDNKKLWYKDGQLQLQLLREEIEKTEKRMNYRQWFLNFVSVSSWLAFKRVYLILDLDNTANLSEVSWMLLPLRSILCECGISIFVFSAPVHVVPANFFTHCFILGWNHEQLRDMLLHRWNQTNSPETNQITEIITNAEIDKLIKESQNNPRRLSQLWSQHKFNDERAR